MTKSVLYIDGPNLYYMAKALHKAIDYAKLYEHFNADGNLMRAYYYTAIDHSNDVVAIRPLLDYLDHNNYTVVSKDAKVQTNSAGERRVKGNMDIDLCVDAMLMAGHTTDVYLFTGDGDFVPLVRALKQLGNRVTVVATIKVQPPMCAPELRREADRFIELSDLRALVNEGEQAWRVGKKAHG